MNLSQKHMNRPFARQNASQNWFPLAASCKFTLPVFSLVKTKFQLAKNNFNWNPHSL